jgi:dTDP-4-amino-4,6-dideoxygalactose transaminase
MPVLLPEGTDREAFMARLRGQGVQSSIHYPPIHAFSHYRALAGGAPPSLPLTEAYARREVTLPLHAGLTSEDVGRICEAVRLALE